MADSRNVKAGLVEEPCNQKIIDMAKNDLDWHVRLDAVENINDENVLKEIVNDELTSAVAIKALENIKDKEFLADTCLNHPDSYIRLACMNRISDESLFTEEELSHLLEKILLNDTDSYILKSACENPNLTNQEVLIELANSSSDEAVKRHAIKKITDEAALKNFALNDSDTYIRREAISNPNLANLDVIYDVIRLDSDEFNRIMAIYKIPDGESLIKLIFKKPLHHRLAEIAKNTNFSMNDYFLNIFETETDEYKRRVVVNFIEDLNILYGIALNESNDEIRADAIGNDNFTNQEILEELLFNESDPEILLQVVSKIKNQESLVAYVENHLDYNDVTVKAISRLEDMDFLEGLSNHPDSRVRLEAVKRISKFKHSDELLRDIAITEENADICIIAVKAMNVRNDLIEVADKRNEKNIRIVALDQIKAKRLLDNYIGSGINHSSEDLSFEDSLKDMALNDGDDDIRKIATEKLDDMDALYDIASSEDVNGIDARNRLDTLFEDIKRIDNETVLKRLIECENGDVVAMAQATLDDSKTWESRIAEINQIMDIDTLKDISQNDFNYFVRNEAGGRLEKILFNIRLDEIGYDVNQEKLKAIANDEGFSQEIRQKALLKITDEDFPKILKQN